MGRSADDFPDQPGRHPPDGAALVVPDGHLRPASGPGVVPGNAHGAVGEVLRHLGEELIAPDVRRRLPEEGQGDGERLRHLRRGGAHGGQPPGGHQSQHRPEEEAPLVADKIRRAQGGDRLPGDGQLLLRLPEGAVQGALPRLHFPAGEAYLAPLAELGGPNLEEEAEAVRSLQQGAEDGVAPGGPQKAGLVVLKAAGQPRQLPGHSSMVSAWRRFSMSTAGTLGAYSPSRDQGRSSAVSRWMEETWRKTRPWLSYCSQRLQEGQSITQLLLSTQPLIRYRKQVVSTRNSYIHWQESALCWWHVFCIEKNSKKGGYRFQEFVRLPGIEKIRKSF